MTSICLNGDEKMLGLGLAPGGTCTGEGLGKGGTFTTVRITMQGLALEGTLQVRYLY